jgi:hypothetical protein
LFVGERGALLSGFSGGIRFLSEEQERSLTAPPKTLPRTKGHYLEWIDACKGGPAANCNFDFAAPLTETVLLGVVAQRVGRYLLWDADGMRFPNDPAATRLLTPEYRSGWSL